MSKLKFVCVTVLACVLASTMVSSALAQNARGSSEGPTRARGYDHPDQFMHLKDVKPADNMYPVIAHPERNPDVQAAPERLDALVDAGGLVQITAASVTGAFGRGTRSTALDLLRSGRAHLLASDDHGGRGRAFELAGIVRGLRSRPLARWLTLDVPGAIVRGEALPERPPARRRTMLF